MVVVGEKKGAERPLFNACCLGLRVNKKLGLALLQKVGECNFVAVLQLHSFRGKVEISPSREFFADGRVDGLLRGVAGGSIADIHIVVLGLMA